MDDFLEFFSCWEYDIQALHEEEGTCDSFVEENVYECRTDVLWVMEASSWVSTPGPIPWCGFRTHLPGGTIHHPPNVNLCFSVAEVVSSLASGLCWHPSEKSRVEQARILFMLSIIAKGTAYYAQNPFKTLGMILLKSWLAEKVFITIILCNNLFFNDIFKEEFIF